MRKILITIVALFALTLLAFAVGVIIRNPSDNVPSQQIEKGTQEQKETQMILRSPAFEHSAPIPTRYTCDGINISPPLSISETSQEAKSLVLTVDDPDAPSGVFTHWLVWNIDPKIKEIKEGEVPNGGIQGTNDFGKTGWGGPCPPSGTHRYYFKLYALDSSLDLATGSKKNQLGAALSQHILEQTELIGTYTRQR